MNKKSLFTAFFFCLSFIIFSVMLPVGMNFNLHIVNASVWSGPVCPLNSSVPSGNSFLLPDADCCKDYNGIKATFDLVSYCSYYQGGAKVAEGHSYRVNKIQPQCNADACQDYSGFYTVCYGNGEHNGAGATCCYDGSSKFYWSSAVGHPELLNAAFTCKNPAPSSSSPGFTTPGATGVVGLPPINTANLTISDICSGYVNSIYSAKDMTPGSSRFSQYDYELQSCYKCLGQTAPNITPNINKAPSTGNSFTSLGCISTSISGQNSVATSIFRIFYGLGLLLALFKGMTAGIKLMNASNPEAIKESREELIAIATAFLFASAGLIGLSYVGVDVLGLGPYLSNLPKVI